MTTRTKELIPFIAIPLLVIVGTLLYVFMRASPTLIYSANIIASATIILGSWDLLKKIITSLRQKQFALDYIAILAIVVGVSTGQLLVSLIIVLMISTGGTLENYGMAKAKQSLTALTDRIPTDVLLWKDNQISERRPIGGVSVGEQIAVRKGEVVPLDGTLVSAEATTDESSLTGEPYMIEKVQGDTVRSGTVNVGNLLVLRVTKSDENSTYRKIIDMVKRAQDEKSPLLRLADRYSTIFTIITFVLCALAYTLSHDINRVLAVLVVATPCPLILATPIALFGGMNAAAKNRILIKTLASLEVLSRASDIVLDKTGTITLGRPLVSNLTIIDQKFDEKTIYGIAEAIERNSLHPLAKAVVEKAKDIGAHRIIADTVDEQLGSGISASINGNTYTLSKMTKYHHSNAIELHENDRCIARLEFEDRLKNDSSTILADLKTLNLSLHIFTGDREENAKKIIAQLGDAGSSITVRANCTPEDKKNGVRDLKQQGAIVAMVGDGINDAPALAIADVGMVFSNEEQTAASEAADIVFLGGDLSSVTFILSIAKQTIRIALQSIWFGIGVSILLMFLAAFGHIPPIIGSFLQEAIDVVVIFNALRTSRIHVT